MSPEVPRVESVVRTIADTCIENEKYFGDLDSVVGDGDFGFSLARGFENVVAQWDTFDRSDAGTFLQKVAIVMTGRIGGTSGPIWGTAFLRAAAVVKGKPDASGEDVVAMLRAAIEGIKARGGADLGEKTLLDALAPMADTIEANLGADPKDVATRAAQSAREAAEATKSMQARRGRASYTGERSIGSVDPGAIAVAVLAEKVAETW
ncbi:dihydroxyacetone kinase subunit DhaL [Cellulomonas sp. McL0617]|uniref:dihydroxyacetone kinase subunit DhaL n=1 Tax=Cellulomonas sp. McL0617 TaxID=3415675 RepID=UPI003CF23D9F